MKHIGKIILFAAIVTAFSCVGGCKEKTSNSAIKPVTSYEKFQNIVTSSGDRLLVFEMYADWCGPCKKLAPILEQVAVENKDKADIYKVDVMKFPKIAEKFGVKGIPFVQFIKNKEILISLTGLRKKADYVRAIGELTNAPPKNENG